jgi:hypothetical protein
MLRERVEESFAVLVRASARCVKDENTEVLTGEFTGTPASLRLQPE